MRQPAFLLIALVAAAVLLNAAKTGRTSAGIDYYQFWAIVEATRSIDVGNFYSGDEPARVGGELLRRAIETDGADRFQAVAKYRQVLDANQSPFLYVALSPLISGDYEADFRLFRHLTLLLGTGGIILLAVLAGLAPIECLGVVLLVLAAFEPLRSDLRVGNVGQLQLAAVTLYAWNQSRSPSTPRDVLGGAVLALAVLFKPTMVVVAAVLGISWLVAGAWRKCRDQAIGGVLGGAVAWTLVGLFFGRSGIWLDFLDVLPVREEIIELSDGNWAPASVLLDLTGRHVAPVLLIAMLGLTGGLLWRQRERLQRTQAPDLLGVALGCLVLLLASPVAWIHYYLLVTPALVLAVRAVKTSRRPAAAMLAIGAGLLPLLDSPLLSLGLRDHVYATWTSAGVVGLYVLSLRGLAAGAYDPEP